MVHPISKLLKCQLYIDVWTQLIPTLKLTLYDALLSCCREQNLLPRISRDAVVQEAVVGLLYSPLLLTRPPGGVQSRNETLYYKVLLSNIGVRRGQPATARALLVLVTAARRWTIMYTC